MAWRRLKSYRFTRLIGVLIVLALAVPLAPVQAGGPTFSWTMRPVRFMRDGTAYLLSIGVSEFGSNAHLVIEISKTRNPPGVRHSLQQHTWFFEIDPNSVNFNPNNLSTASIDTGTQLGDFGSIDLQFSADEPLRRSCRGHSKRREGRVTGSVNFDTQTNFGSVTRRPARGDLFHHDGANCPNDAGGNRCPAESRSFNGDRSAPTPPPDPMSMLAFRRNRADSARVSVGYIEEFTDPAGSIALHEIAATVPGENVSIASHLSFGSATGAPGTWVSGTAEFSATGDPSDPIPTNCRRGKEWINVTRLGTVTGDLTGNFFIGSDRSLSDGDMDGFASKLVVRDR